MKININILKRFSSKIHSVIEIKNEKMEKLIKDIFYASVNSVKPHELITKNNLIKISSENKREFIEIKNKDRLSKIDVTGKKIHLGEFVNSSA